jgi:CMP-N-acetylneuraminic acid synthetase
MLRPFVDTTLTGLMLSKLTRFGPKSFFAGYEEEFRALCEAAGVHFVQRDLNSISIDEPIADILSFLRGVEYEYLLWINPCLPLLEVDTIRAFLDDCVAHGCRPAFPVVRRSTHFLRVDGSAVNFDATAKTLNTKTVEPIYEMAHAFYFFNRQFFLENGRYWNWDDVRIVELEDTGQLLDIDEERDFSAAERVWKLRSSML